MIEKQFYELGVENDVVLPDLDMTSSYANSNSFIGDFSSNVYFHPEICKEMKKETDEVFDKKLNMISSKINESSLELNPGEKPSLERLSRRNRLVKKLRDGSLNPKSHDFLMTAVDSQNLITNHC